jgi:hypothetical protein
MSERELLLVAVVEFGAGQEQAGIGYEDAVLDLLERHGGTVQRRLRATDSATEVQVIRFAARAGLESFLADPDRLALRDRIGPGTPTTRVIEVSDV